MALLPTPVTRAAPNAMPVIEKTVDHGTLLGNTISTRQGLYRATLRFIQMEIYTLVRDRWKAMGVFAPVAAVVAPLGYDAVFDGYEKLFVFSAEKCFFYWDSEDLGIRKTDRFPYPGTLFFTLKPKR